MHRAVEVATDRPVIVCPPFYALPLLSTSQQLMKRLLAKSSGEDGDLSGKVILHTTTPLLGILP